MISSIKWALVDFGYKTGMANCINVWYSFQNFDSLFEGLQLDIAGFHMTSLKFKLQNY